MEKKLAENVMRRMCVGDMIRRRALNEPNKEALVNSHDGNITRRVTYRELNNEANRFANALTSLGIKKGDKVAIFSHNCVQYIDFVVAATKMGTWITPINFALHGREILPLLNHSKATLLVVEDILIEAVNEIKDKIPSVEHFIMINLKNEISLPEGWLDFDDLTSDVHSDDEPYVEIHGDDVLTLMYTSGTESMPKGVLNSHANWFSSLFNFTLDFGRNTPATAIQLGALPFFHVAGHMAIFLSLIAGDKIIILNMPDPGIIMQRLQDEKITSVGLPPTMFVNMLRMPDGDKLMKQLFGSVRTCTLYGSPLSSGMMQKIVDVLPDIYWQNYYGQSEITPLGTTLKSPDLIRKFVEAEERFGGAEPIGQSHALVEMKVVDENNIEVPPGTVGEIVARSPAVMRGYYKMEEKTERAFQDGWHHTGDLAVMDEERFYYFIDRKKDIIKTGAENVSSVEVEGWISKFPNVSECAVVGLPEDRWGEAVTAFVVPQPEISVDEKEIIQYCKEGIAGYKVPKKVVILKELPKTSSGKFLKRDLRVEYNDLYKNL